ncbi:MAG TPA: TIM barrel protein [Gemmatimonadales bacterium]|jgi:hydroxypyruvate isomerase
MKRRDFLATTAIGATVAGSRGLPSTVNRQPSTVAGRLKQSVCRWPYGSIPLPEFCRAAKGIGLDAIDLLQQSEWPVARDAGLVCSLGYPSPRRDFNTWGFNDPAHHPVLLRELEETIPAAAASGVPNVIAMFGNRGALSDAAAIDACVQGLNRIKALGEEHRVTICLEMLNTRVDHQGYQADHTAFGLAVARAVDSPRVRLLFDIYHMQIMEGDIIHTIRDNAPWIAHFHTGGVPGRHELDNTQELNYNAIARAIADTGYGGYVAHEFIPTHDPLTSLREAVTVCTV